MSGTGAELPPAKNCNETSSSSFNPNNNASPTDARGDYPDNFDLLHQQPDSGDNEEDGLFAADLNVESPPAEAADGDQMNNQGSTNSQGSSNMGSGFLPDILGEERQSVSALQTKTRDEIILQLRKVETLVKNAQDIQKRYENISDPDGQKTVMDMLGKLHMQQHTLETQLAEISVRGHGADQQDRVQQPDLAVRQSSSRSAPPQPSQQEFIPPEYLAHSMGVLRQNLTEVLQRKADLESLIGQLKLKRQHCQTDAERLQFTNLLDRHEERVADLEHTVGEAKKTLLTMEDLQSAHPELASRVPAAANLLVDEQGDDDEDGTPVDVSAMQGLRARLQELRNKVSGMPSGSQQHTQETRQSDSNVGQRSAQSQQPTVVRETHPKKSVPRQSGAPHGYAEEALYLHEHPRRLAEAGMRANAGLLIPPPPRKESRNRRQAGTVADARNRSATFPNQHSQTLLNNAVNPEPRYDDREMPRFVRGPRAEDSQTRSARESREMLELYGLSSKSGDDYYIIDNIHNQSGPSRALPFTQRDPDRGTYDDRSSESENDNFGAFVARRRHGREMEDAKRDHPSFRNDLTAAKKNFDANNSPKDVRMHGLSSAQAHDPRIQTDYHSSDEQRARVSRPHEIPVPEVVAALQVIMAEQQKILNSCAQFVSKPSVNYDCYSVAQPGSEQIRKEEKMERRGRDIPIINNALRERPAAHPSYFDQRAADQSAMLNNQRQTRSPYSQREPDRTRQPSGSRNETMLQREPEEFARSNVDYPRQTNRSRRQRQSPEDVRYRPRPAASRRDDRHDDCTSREDPSRAAAYEANSHAKPLLELFQRIVRDYENDLGSLYFMLESLASLRSSYSRVTVAAQLGLLVAAERNRQSQTEHARGDQGSFSQQYGVAENLDLLRGYLPSFQNIRGNNSVMDAPPDLVGYQSSTPELLPAFVRTEPRSTANRPIPTATMVRKDNGQGDNPRDPRNRPTTVQVAASPRSQFRELMPLDLMDVDSSRMRHHGIDLIGQAGFVTLEMDNGSPRSQRGGAEYQSGSSGSNDFDIVGAPSGHGADGNDRMSGGRG